MVRAGAPWRQNGAPPPVRILLTGHTGFLGHHLRDALRGAGVECTTAGRRDADVRLDLDHPSTLGQAVASARPDVVLHAAATSAMGACAADPEGATRRNGEAAGALAAAGAWLVFVSTDLVFDGTAAPYRATDAPRPLSAYGRSKALGEERVLAGGGMVVRVPLLFGPSFDGRRGASDMLRAAARDGRTLRLFVDEFRSPLHVVDAARALVAVACGPPRAGVMHVAGPERVSRLEFAERFAVRHGWNDRPWLGAESEDPTRPRDVTLVGDVAMRSLDAMLDDA